jgi:hypothetical protein
MFYVGQIVFEKKHRGSVKVSIETLHPVFFSYYEKGDEALDKFFRSGHHLAKRAGNEAGRAANVSDDFFCFLTASKSVAHRDRSREWNVSKQKWNLC